MRLIARVGALAVGFGAGMFVVGSTLIAYDTTKAKQRRTPQVIEITRPGPDGRSLTLRYHVVPA